LANAQHTSQNSNMKLMEENQRLRSELKEQATEHEERIRRAEQLGNKQQKMDQKRLHEKNVRLKLELKVQGRMYEDQTTRMEELAVTMEQLVSTRRRTSTS